MTATLSPEAALAPETLAHIRDHYLEPKSEWARERIARVLDAVSLRPGERFLDLGCANGTFSFHGGRGGARAVAVDRDEAVLRTGRAAAAAVAGAAAAARTTRICADARRLPFRRAVFPAIINADFIEHVPDEAKTAIFLEMHRVLTPAGRAVVYSPNRDRVRAELAGERIKRRLGWRQAPVPEWKDYVDPDHFGMTSPGETMRRLRQCGFRVTARFFEFHAPLLSRLPGFNRLAAPFLGAWFANRFLIECRK